MKVAVIRSCITSHTSTLHCNVIYIQNHHYAAVLWAALHVLPVRPSVRVSYKLPNLKPTKAEKPKSAWTFRCVPIFSSKFRDRHRTSKSSIKLCISRVITGRPGRCPEIPEILKFVLKCPEIGVRSWNLYIYPEIFTRFHNLKKTHTSFYLFYLWVSNTGHKESSVVPDFSIKMACRGHSRSIILCSLESR